MSIDVLYWIGIVFGLIAWMLIDDYKNRERKNTGKSLYVER